FAKIARSSLVSNDTTVNDGVAYKNNYATNKKEAENYTLNPFEFDPNTIDETSFQKLGLSPKIIKTILNYRSKGGKFYKPDDFRKIWGLKQEDADVLVPYITIATPSNNRFGNKVDYKNKSITPTKIDINTATVNDFRQLPAVGNLAYKIVKYRDKLGGFLSINQIRETYDLTDSIYNAMLPYLTLQTIAINKLNINTATDFELGGHPYISKEIAKAIVIYRTQHGNYNSVNDLKKIIFIKKEVVDKIAPYLTVDAN
ncbi:MAG: helix-hairpin-helix domain-containing protein, partial [Bacteroidetes bacterium]|nr:helix-hairpin-helix domain-containing protein [Bacteroidota bacterium]